MSSPSAPRPTDRIRRSVVLTALMLPALITSIDTTVMYVAIPEITKALHASDAAVLWISNGYSLALASLLITVGVVCDRVGSRTMLLIGALGFGTVSFLASLSSSAQMLILFRVALGVFAAALGPATLATIRGMYSAGKERNWAIGVWSATFSVGAVVGPVVGGWLMTIWGWPAIFLINVPVCALFLLIAPWALTNVRHVDAVLPDAMTIVLLPISLGGISFALITIGDVSLLFTTASLLLGVGAAVVFVRHQLRMRRATVDMRLFRSPAFSASVIANVADVLGLTGLAIVLSEFLQLAVHRTVFELIGLLLPGVLAALLTSLIAAKVPTTARYSRWVPPAGVVTAVGCLILTGFGAQSIWPVILAFLLVGAGVGFAETLTNRAILDAAPPARAAAASAISETGYEVGSAIGIALIGAVMHLAYQFGMRGAEPPAAASSFERASQIAMAHPGDYPLLTGQAFHAFQMSAQTASAAAAIILLIAAACTWILYRRGEAEPIAAR